MPYSGGGDITNGTHTHGLCHECYKAGDENARLQKQVKDTETFIKEVREYRDFWLAKYDEATIKHHDALGRLKRDCDHYKALATKYMAADFARAATEEEKS